MAELLGHLTTASILPTDEPYTSRKRRWQARNLLLEKEAGRQYGLWVVASTPIPLSCTPARLWCRCMHCGTNRLVRIADLRQGSTKSCGELSTVKSYRGVPEKPRHQLMQRYNRIQVCTSPTSKNRAHASYRRWGITNKFLSCQHFVAYMWKHFQLQDYTGWEVDRIDNDGHYEPGNVQLLTRQDNAQKRHCNVLVEYQGVVMSTYKFCREAKLRFHSSTVLLMLHNGATPEQIIQHQHQKVPGVTSNRKRAKRRSMT